MKKHGKKWRAEQSKKQPSHKEQLLELELNLKRSPRTKEDIATLRDKAYAILCKLPEKEKQIRIWHKCDLRRYHDEMTKKFENPNPSLREFKDIIEIIMSESTIEYPVPFPNVIGICPATRIEPKLSHKWKEHAKPVITELSYLFGVFKNDTETVLQLVAEDYPWEQNGLLPLAERYLDILCRITEGTTWVSRKNTNLLIEKVKQEAICPTHNH